MPSIVATVKVKEDKVEEAKSFLKDLVAEVRANEPGTLAYVFHQKQGDPTTFVAYEKYDSDESFKKHSAGLAAKGAGFAAILAGAPEIVMLEEI
jgi:quinol monooxygenase YgiN